jgi:hypothetical protein
MFVTAANIYLSQVDMSRSLPGGYKRYLDGKNIRNLYLPVTAMLAAQSQPLLILNYSSYH